MRGKQAPKREIAPDPKFNNTTLAKFINYIMQRGKKSVARDIVYDSFDIIEEKTKQKGLDIFNLAIKNVSPQVEVKARRIGGANYQVPIEVKGNRKFNLASRWLLEAAKKRKGMRMCEKLALELIDASNEQGDAVKKREDVHRMAESNRAFAHFA
ncbi:MAG: 30S ribosomal protein S7 [Patescibacteria group bacterium]